MGESKELETIKTFVCYYRNGSSFEHTSEGRSVMDIPFIVEESSDDISALKNAHGGDLRQFLISYTQRLQRSETPVTLKDFTHMRLSLWEEAPTAYPPRSYIPMDQWISIAQFTEDSQCGYVLKNVAADHIYQGGNLILQFKKESAQTSQIRSPTWAQVEEALREGAAAVVWTSTRVISLDFKPMLPGQFRRAFERAGVAVCDTEGQWLYEMRLLGMGPSVYALGSKDGREEVWANNTDVVSNASVYLREKAGVQEIIKSAVVVYYE